MGVSEEDFELYFLLLLIGTFAALSFAVFLPYLFYILGGVILVYINYPLYRKIQQMIGNASIAALLSIIILLVVTILPTIFMVSTTAAQGQALLEQVGTAFPEYVNTTAVETEIAELTGRHVDVQNMVTDAANSIGSGFSSELPSLIRTAINLIIGVLLMGFTMYYLFKDGDKVLNGVLNIMPLRDSHQERLLTEANSMAEAILIGHLLTSAVQGIIAGIGLWAVGIPNVIFWTFVMIILGLVPIIGNFFVWAPAGIYLIFAQTDVLGGLALLLYGTTVVAFTDNIVRAKFVESRANIHPLLVLIGVIGGLPLFGLLGVVLGPLTLGFTVALLRVYNTDFWRHEEYPATN